MEKFLSKIIISKKQINTRLQELAALIDQDYHQKESFVMVGLLKGCNPFFIDLLKKIKVEPIISYMSVCSYEETHSTGQLTIKLDLDVKVQDAHILLVDDIIDTGLTLKSIKNLLLQRGAREVKTCVLLAKNVHRDIQADYVGFPIENEFVIGYGLDYNQKYRNLAFIGVYNPNYEA
ncbi:MAG: hypoxanthine phosphoribosyltransferase [Acholeplasmatales bacterium]|jgi:hypoxanthine phosphoribosyltransferase|nr:hypoxanthine phosphoribosyltransferase [Acholeplasmatales bacterium]